MSEGVAEITIADFSRVELRVAKVVEAREHPNADKLLVLKVDLGTEERQICAGIRAFYKPEDLVGRLIIVVANLAPRTMRGEESQGMLLAASNAEHTQVVLVGPWADVPPGSGVG